MFHLLVRVFQLFNHKIQGVPVVGEKKNIPSFIIYYHLLILLRTRTLYLKTRRVQCNIAAQRIGSQTKFWQRGSNVLVSVLINQPFTEKFNRWNVTLKQNRIYQIRLDQTTAGWTRLQQTDKLTNWGILDRTRPDQSTLHILEKKTIVQRVDNKTTIDNMKTIPNQTRLAYNRLQTTE